MSGLAVIGECMVEIAPAGGGLHRLGYAGDTFNAAWCSRLLLPADRPVRYVTNIGTDWVSDELHAFMAAAGLDLTFVRRDPVRTPGLYAVRLDEHGERSFAYWRSGSAATTLADDGDHLRRSIEDVDIVLFSGITLAILSDTARLTLFETLGNARRRGVSVAFDPNHRPRLWRDADMARETLTRFAGIVDIVLPSFSDEHALFGDDAPETTARRFAALGVREIVVKDGPGDALCISSGGTEQVAPLVVDQAVDTTGAGDAFNGAYLAARLSGDPVAEAAAYAHRAAAIAIMTRGALVPRDLATRLAR